MFKVGLWYLGNLYTMATNSFFLPHGIDMNISMNITRGIKYQLSIHKQYHCLEELWTVKMHMC
jgi:hypothetical protein